jgi:hypothetical protein
MKELLDKISSYNIFNYLFPGVIFAVIANRITHYPFIQEDVIVGAFLYYFIGLVISRFGSLLIEPILKWLHFVKFAGYKEFVTASKKDEKLELLSEVNNMYRTLISLFLLIFLLRGYEKIESKYCIPSQWSAGILILLLITMFLFAYRKQTSYIKNRIEASGV